MKKFILCAALAMMAVAASAHPKNGPWRASSATDEYTDARCSQVVYDISDPIGFIRYLDNSLEILLAYSPTDNFDVCWDAVMNSNGWIQYTSDLDLNFLGSSPVELSGQCTIRNTERIASCAPSNIFGLHINIDDEDGNILDLLKANTKLKIRYYDIIKERTHILDVSLVGFTAQCKKVGL